MIALVSIALLLSCEATETAVTGGGVGAPVSGGVSETPQTGSGGTTTGGAAEASGTRAGITAGVPSTVAGSTGVGGVALATAGQPATAGRPDGVAGSVAGGISSMGGMGTTAGNPSAGTGGNVSLMGGDVGDMQAHRPSVPVVRSAGAKCRLVGQFSAVTHKWPDDPFRAVSSQWCVGTLS